MACPHTPHPGRPVAAIPTGWYADLGRDLLAAADRQIDQYGFATEACGSPNFDRSGTSAEAKAMRLLAHAALGRHCGPDPAP